MFRAWRVMSVFRSLTRARSVCVESATLPLDSQGPLDRRPTTVRSLLAEQSKKELLVKFPGDLYEQEKLPTLAKVALQAARRESVNLSLLRDVVRAFPQNAGAEETSENLLMTLDLMGSMIKTYNRADYVALLDKVWALRTSVKLNISHYNAYLKATMRAEIPTDMETCFKEMAEHGLTPDGTTYQLFLENLCERGRVDCALEIASKMETEDKTREVYHALIMGHLKVGDATAARDILCQMKAQRIVPNSETYTTLACGLAENGRHAEVLEAITKGKLSAQKMLCILKSTSDAKLMEQVCERILKSNMSASEVGKCCVELIHARKLDEARLIVEKLIKNRDLSFFTDQMVASEYPAEQVVAFCRSIECEEKRAEAMRAAAKRAVHDSKPPAALEYFTALRLEGFSIREHFFYPLICRASTESEAFNVLREMLNWNSHDPEMILTYLFAKLIDERRINPAEALAQVEQWRLPGEVAKRALARYYLTHREFRDCSRALDLLDTSIWQQFVPLIAEETTLANGPSSLLLIEEIMKRAESHREDIWRVYERHLSEVVASKIVRKPLEVTILTYSQPRNTWLTGKKVDFPRNEISLFELCESSTTHAVVRHLETLDEDELDENSLRCLVSFFLKVDDLDRVLHFYNLARKISKLPFDDGFFLYMISIMIKRGRYAEALLTAKEREFKKENHKNPWMKASRVASVLERCLQHASFDAAVEMAQVLSAKCFPLQSHALSPLIEYTLQNRPYRIVRVFENLEKTCGSTPGLLQIYRYLITQKRDRDIRSLHAIAARRHSRDAADLYLAVAYILERDTQQAKRILQDIPKTSKHLHQLKSWFEGMLRKGSREELEEAFKMFCECGLNYEPLYLILAELYARERNVEKTQRLLLTSQKYNVCLSKQTRLIIARTFEAEGKTPPFVCPES